jgi:hypothetical protein
MTATKLKIRQYSIQSARSSKVTSSTIRVPSSQKWQTKKQKDLPKLEFVPGQRLSSHLIDLIDGLTDAHQDWICLLDPDWEIDLCTFNLLSAGVGAVLQKSKVQRMGDIIPSIQEARYQPMMIAQQMRWVYSCCLQIKGLGRVRAVIDFNSAPLTNAPVIFATNRLDWSSRKILTQWCQRRPAEDIAGEKSQKLLLEAFSP